MVHLILAGLVMVSGSHTTSTTAGAGHVGSSGGGAIFKVRVQTVTSTSSAPITQLKPVPAKFPGFEIQQALQAQLAARARYCKVWYPVRTSTGELLYRELTFESSPLSGCMVPFADRGFFY